MTSPSDPLDEMVVRAMTSRAGPSGTGTGMGTDAISGPLPPAAAAQVLELVSAAARDRKSVV